MSDDAGKVQVEQSLKRLARVVTVLTSVMVAGLLLVIGLMAAKLLAPSAPVLPEQVKLDDDARAVAVTAGEGWFLVLTDAEEVLVFDSAGTLRQRVKVGP